MKVTFRTDAALQIGTGHVMRCLTLADTLTTQGADCRFLCRMYEGNLIELICSKGYIVHVLQRAGTGETNSAKIHANAPGPKLAHSQWLGATQTQDVVACLPIVSTIQPDWLIVDHYALDEHWERPLRQHCRKLMVIDDLADRRHVCDLLLDQTFGRAVVDYRFFVPASCQVLCGSQYALLRPDFATLRPYSLQRRIQAVLRDLLITMGGVDKDNVTGQVLQALRTCPLPTDCRITVVMGATAPWLEKVRKQAQEMPWPTRVLVGVNTMAHLMADSDLAIGAAGATSWERCCLGLPTLMLVLAENQRSIAQGLQRSGAAKLIYLNQNLKTQLKKLLVPIIDDASQLLHMSECAASIADGSGVNAVIRQMKG